MESKPHPAASSNQKAFAVLGSFLLTLLIIYVDYLSGLEVHLTALLIIPVYFATWYGGPRAGIAFSFLCASSLLIDPLLERKIYPHLWEVFWNMVVLLIFFSVFTYLLARLKRELEHTREMARTDNLTGLLNARAFFELADQERERAIRYGHPLTLCFLDLDNFKQVNDKLGHMTGDELLRIVAEALRENIRSSDTAARLGGDEFVALFPETGEGDILEPILQQLHGAVLQAIQRHGWTVTPSIGVATFYEVPGSVNDMLHHADELMYEAKRAGKNRVQLRTLGVPPPGRKTGKEEGHGPLVP